MITAREYFSRNRVAIPDRDIGSCHRGNAEDLLTRVNKLLAAFDAERGSHWVAIVSSGYRTPAINASIKNASKRSNHMRGLAVDIRDAQQQLKRFIKTEKGLATLVDAGLYCEHFDYTKTWVHLQTTEPGSGARFFTP
jgi:uncharacterized protein YcbK (DUF882 family)